MRRLPKEMNYVPKIILLPLPYFLIFGAIAAIERLIIADGLIAFLVILSSYLLILLYIKYFPPHFFRYFLTKVSRFELKEEE